MADSSYRQSDKAIKIIDNGDGTYIQAMTIADESGSLNVNSDGSIDVRIPNGPNIDAFGRFRVSNPQTIFDSQPDYGLNKFLWNTSITGSATVSIVSSITESQHIVTIGSNKGDKAILQSKKYIRYQPSKSQLVAMTGNFNGTKEGIRKRIGYFDDSNGMFFEVSGNTVSTVIRSATSGSVYDDVITRDNWNIDKMDGNGESGKILDLSKMQIFLMDFQALYAGRVRFGFDIAGKNYTVNQDTHANEVNLPYLQTPNLPLRYEIEALTTVSTDTSMTAICACVISEGGVEQERAISHSEGTKDVLASVSTRRPILSIRSAQTFSNKQNRTEIQPETFDLYASSQAIEYELVLNGSISTASWTRSSTTVAFEYDTSSIAISGGEVIGGGFVAAGANIRSSVSAKILSQIALTRSIDNTTSDVISIVATGIGGTANVGARITAREVY